MRFLRRLIAASLLLALAGMGGLFWLIHQPYQGFSQPVIVEIPQGSGSRRIAELLSDAGVVRHSALFLAARALRPKARLSAGEYQFVTAASPATVLDRLARGDILLHEVSIPEGFNMFDIAALLDREGLIPGAAFLAVAKDPTMIRDLAPDAPSLEGYLFPDTYRFPRNVTPAQFCRALTKRFREKWRALKPPSDRPANEVVTLASLVEKETGIPEERPLVAAVFSNRLAAGIKLDCDPTTVYAALLSGNYRGTIYRSDLDRNHPYNTYQRTGLPPGPIANPGVESIRAALSPASVDYLFFVARPDGSGHHEFNQSLAAHEAAATRYRRGQQSNQPKAPGRPVPAR